MRVTWLGSKQLGLRTLQALHELVCSELVGAVTINDTEDTRTMYYPIRDYCKENKIALFVVSDRTEMKATLRNLRPEMCIVTGWYWIIDRETLSMAQKGFIGVHNALLPKYRGWAPLTWQIINGERCVGYSVFSLTEEMDAGDIWQQGTVTVEDNDCVGSLLEKLEGQFLAWFKGNFHRILAGEIKPNPQDHSKATYCARRNPFDGIIDWKKPARDIHNFIRAQSEPYLGAFTYYDQRKLTVWKAHPSDLTYYGSPGQVARRGEDGLCVICGDNKPIILELVQLDGDAKRSALEVIMSTGTRLSI